MKKQISTAQTDSNIKEVMRLLRETPAKLEGLSKGLSDKQLHEPLGAGERSLTEALAHLINCEAINSEAIYLALLVDEPLLAGIHAERDLGKLLRFDLLPFPELMAYFKLRRSVMLRILESLTEEKWSRCIRETGKQRKESVYWRARGHALHELEHLLDLENKLEKS
jgi:DinB superfamily